ncbi:hypothetical protein Tco_0144589 [Tanacetum coccineum]
MPRGGMPKIPLGRSKSNVRLSRYSKPLFQKWRQLFYLSSLSDVAELKDMKEAVGFIKWTFKFHLGDGKVETGGTHPFVLSFADDLLHRTTLMENCRPFILKNFPERREEIRDRGYTKILITTSPTLTPFEGSVVNFILEEIEAELSDTSYKSGINDTECDPEKDILLLEAILNSEPLSPLLKPCNIYFMSKVALKGVCSPTTQRDIAWKLSDIKVVPNGLLTSQTTMRGRGGENFVINMDCQHSRKEKFFKSDSPCIAHGLATMVPTVVGHHGANTQTQESLDYRNSFLGPQSYKRDAHELVKNCKLHASVSKSDPNNDAGFVVRFLESSLCPIRNSRKQLSVDRGTHFCYDQFAKVMLNMELPIDFPLHTIHKQVDKSRFPIGA